MMRGYRPELANRQVYVDRGEGNDQGELLNWQGNAQGVHHESISALAFDYLVRAGNQC